MQANQRVAQARQVACPDCGHREWEIALGRARKEPRHPQERSGVWGRLALCFATLCVAVPAIGAVSYTLSQTAGAFAALLGMSGATAGLIMLILIIEGFGSSSKIGALRCLSCGFEQRAEIRPK